MKFFVFFSFCGRIIPIFFKNLGKFDTSFKLFLLPFFSPFLLPYIIAKLQTLNCFLDTNGYKCECGRTFHTYTDLLYHKHPGEDDDVPVVEEAVVVRSRSRFPESEFPAPDFAIKGYEPKHPMKVYSDVRSKPYICQYCSKSYSDSRYVFP